MSECRDEWPNKDPQIVMDYKSPKDNGDDITCIKKTLIQTSLVCIIVIFGLVVGYVLMIVYGCLPHIK